MYIYVYIYMNMWVCHNFTSIVSIYSTWRESRESWVVGEKPGRKGL